MTGRIFSPSSCNFVGHQQNIVLWKFSDENQAKNTKLDETKTEKRNKKKSSVILLWEASANWQIWIACRLANMKLSIRTSFCLTFCSSDEALVEAENEPRLKFHFDLKRTLRQTPLQELWEFHRVRPPFLGNEEKSLLKFKQFRMLFLSIFVAKPEWFERKTRSSEMSTSPATRRISLVVFNFEWEALCGVYFTWREFSRELLECLKIRNWRTTPVLGIRELWSSFKGRDVNNLIEASVKWLPNVVQYLSREPNLSDSFKILSRVGNPRFNVCSSVHSARMNWQSGEQIFLRSNWWSLPENFLENFAQ